MYAVITTGGKQYRVKAGDRLRVEKLSTPVGETVEFGAINLLVNEDGIVSDVEALSSARVTAEVLGEGRKKKIRVFKYKRRKNYHRTIGHRQWYTDIQIRDIVA